MYVNDTTLILSVWFFKGFRTTSADITLINEISKSLNDGTSVVAAFYVLTRAFDCVEHVVLLDRMKHYGFKDVKSWLA